MIDWRSESLYVTHILRTVLNDITITCFSGSHNAVREVSKFPIIYELTDTSALEPLTSSLQLLWHSQSIIIWWEMHTIRVVNLVLTIEGSYPTLDHLSHYQVSPRRPPSNKASNVIDV